MARSKVVSIQKECPATWGEALQQFLWWKHPIPAYSVRRVYHPVIIHAVCFAAMAICSLSVSEGSIPSIGAVVAILP